MSISKGDIVGLLVDGIVCRVEGVVVNDFGTHAFVSWPEMMDFSLHSKKKLYLIHKRIDDEREQRKRSAGG